MKISRFSVGKLVLAALATAAVACSDGNGEGTSRATLLEFSAAQIAAAALADAPPSEFLEARGRVAKAVPATQLAGSRSFSLAAGRGPALVTDQVFGGARKSAARALGATLDPAKEADGAAAELSLQALLLALQSKNPVAISCDALGGEKADNCAYALIIIEVRRCEAPRAPGPGVLPDASMLSDATTPGPDAAVVVGDAGDAGISSEGGGPVFGAIECSTRDVTGARIVQGSIDASETWTGKILVKGQLIVRAVTLTIMPGTEIWMDVDSSLELGWNANAATILADGTAAPIKICGTQLEPGSWDGVIVGTNVTTNSVFKNVLIAEGGTATSPALQLQADVLIDGVQVKNAGGVGVRAVDFKEGSRALTITGSRAAAAELTGEGALTRFPLGGTLTGNVDNTLHVNFGSIMTNTTVRNVGVPYVQDVDILQRGGELTFEAGVDYRFKTDTNLSLGWNSNATGVHVNGTATAPVRFRSATEPPSNWGGITLERAVLSNSNLTYMDVRHAGSATVAALDVQAPVLVDNVTLSDNPGLMKIGAAGLKAESRNLTITKSGGRPLSVQASSAVGLPQGGVFTGNTIDQIEIASTRFDRSGTIHDLGVPYYIAGDAQIVAGMAATTLTIAPGTDFVMGPDSAFSVAWSGSAALLANGTAAAPITFTGSNPVAGSWAGVSVEATALSTTVLNYVEITHAGASGAALTLQLALPAANITNSKFVASSGFGIRKRTANMIDYAPTNTFSMNAMANIGDF
jgi:hypothetical protein